MSLNRRLALFLVAIMAPISPGCDRGRDRQMVYPASRGAPVRLDTARGRRDRDVAGKVPTPDPKPIPDSNGIDVPLVEPD